MLLSASISNIAFHRPINIQRIQSYSIQCALSGIGQHSAQLQIVPLCHSTITVFFSPHVSYIGYHDSHGSSPTQCSVYLSHVILEHSSRIGERAEHNSGAPLIGLFTSHVVLDGLVDRRFNSCQETATGHSAAVPGWGGAAPRGHCDAAASHCEGSSQLTAERGGTTGYDWHFEDRGGLGQHHPRAHFISRLHATSRSLHAISRWVHRWCHTKSHMERETETE